MLQVIIQHCSAVIALRLAFAVNHHLAVAEGDATPQQLFFCYHTLRESNQQEGDHFLQSLITVGFDEAKCDLHSMMEMARYCSLLPGITKHSMSEMLQTMEERMKTLRNKAENDHILFYPHGSLHSTVHVRRGQFQRRVLRTAHQRGTCAAERDRV